MGQTPVSEQPDKHHASQDHHDDKEDNPDLALALATYPGGRRILEREVLFADMTALLCFLLTGFFV